MNSFKARFTTLQSVIILLNILKYFEYFKHHKKMSILEENNIINIPNSY